MKAIERLFQYFDYKQFKPTRFEKEIGLSNGYLGTQLRRKADIGSTVLELIANYCDDLNIDWVVTGKGVMLKVEFTPLVSEKEHVYPKSSTPKNAIPLVDLYAIGGFGNSKFSISAQDVKEFYVVPKFKSRKIDFMIEVAGSSMYPKYNSGDVVACTIIRERKFIQWNKVHVIATKEQGILIKRLDVSDKPSHVRAISDNKDYRPFDIPEEEITGLAIVVGVIRLE